MSSYNILSAIKVNAAALADTGYVDEAMPYIGTLEGLFNELERADNMEKAAPTAPTVEAAKENISPSLSDNSKDLSSCFHIGQKVYIADREGKIASLKFNSDFPILVLFDSRDGDGNNWNSYKESDITSF